MRKISVDGTNSAAPSLSCSVPGYGGIHVFLPDDYVDLLDLQKMTIILSRNHMFKNQIPTLSMYIYNITLSTTY